MPMSNAERQRRYRARKRAGVTPRNVTPRNVTPSRNVTISRQKVTRNVTPVTSPVTASRGDRYSEFEAAIYDVIRRNAALPTTPRSPPKAEPDNLPAEAEDTRRFAENVPPLAVADAKEIAVEDAPEVTAEGALL